jgi:isopenicillin N synthase-like dioxygenase
MQVWTKDNTWQDVKIPEDCFCINLGDLMQVKRG